MKRREFLQKAGAASVGLAAASAGLSRGFEQGQALTNNGSPHQRSIKKAIMWATVGLKGSIAENMKTLKGAGFEGVEMMSHMNQDEVVKARDEAGLIIPSVCGSKHWDLPLTDSDPKVREQGLEALKQTLRDAKRYGATSVLLVPGKVTAHVSYADAYTRSQEEIRKAIPLAEELGVKIAIENVWNQFLLSPLEAARYVDEFKSPAVGWHFDVGNVITFGYPEQWIRILGKRIQKLHIKEYSRKKRDTSGPGKGFEVAFLEGDNNWPEVMRALDDIGYHGWGIAEQGGADSPEGAAELSNRMTKIFAS
jgi:L-ribulose-5-phosphate 3-epimerase